MGLHVEAYLTQDYLEVALNQGFYMINKIVCQQISEGHTPKEMIIKNHIVTRKKMC